LGVDDSIKAPLFFLDFSIFTDGQRYVQESREEKEKVIAIEERQ